ncbi:MAG TPA: hypothetical protein DCE78_06345 [Bacteroidetes bacterium]|nr:hypothetical protein [Bacteroidota bacterium]
MINFCIDNLEEIKSLLIKLNSETYNYRSGMLDHGTIGQHCRHVIECYECLIDGNKGQIVDYDLRKRCKMTETDQFVAINKIDSIITELLLMLEDKDLSVKVNFSSIDFNSSHTKSTLHR